MCVLTHMLGHKSVFVCLSLFTRAYVVKLHCKHFGNKKNNKKIVHLFKYFHIIHLSLMTCKQNNENRVNQTIFSVLKKILAIFLRTQAEESTCSMTPQD